MLKVNPLAVAVPFFFLLIGVELAVARRRGVRVHRFSDSLSDLSCGVLQQLSGVFVSGALLALYSHVHANHALFELPASSPVTWLVAFFGMDFVFYWWHRASHRVSFFWAAHVTHHSSEDFNLAVALRQSAFTGLTFFPFYLPLALVGVPAPVFALIAAFSLLYQFWLHTELLGRWPRFERIFNSPSAHRVHHGVNPEYLDTNYGGTLIIWDRLFGTYVPERAPVVYGLVHPLRSFNPVWAQVHHYVALAKRSLQAPRLGDKLRVWVKGPEWNVPGLPAEGPPPEVDRDRVAKFDVPLPRALVAYLAAQFFTFVLVGTTAMMQWGPGLPLSAKVGASAALLFTLLTFGGLLDGSRWALPLERLRLLVLGGAGAALLAPHSLTAALAAGILSTLLLLATFALRRAGMPTAAANAATSS